MNRPTASSNPSALDVTFKVSVSLASLGIVIWLFNMIAEFLSPIILTVALSFVLTYILLAPVNGMDWLFHKALTQCFLAIKRESWMAKIPDNLTRALSILLVYVVSIAFVTVISIRFTPILWNELVMFFKQVPSYMEKTEDWLMDQPILSSAFRSELIHYSQVVAAQQAQQNGGQLAQPGPNQMITLHPTHEPIIQSSQQVPSAAPPIIPHGPISTAPLSDDEKFVIKDRVLNWSERIRELEPLIRQNLNGAVSNVSNIVGTTLSALVYGLTLVVMVFYFLLDGNKLKEGLLKSLPQNALPTATFFVENFHQVMFGFIKTQVLLGIVTGVFMIFVYSILDLPYALFLGAFFAVAEILPVVGTWIGFTPGLIVLFFVSPVKMVIAMAIVYVYQSIKDNLVAPKIVGDIMGLHPVMIILSLLICAKIAGLVGVLFAIPIASMLIVLLTYLQTGPNQEPMAPSAN